MTVTTNSARWRISLRNKFCQTPERIEIFLFRTVRDCTCALPCGSCRRHHGYLASVPFSSRSGDGELCRQRAHALPHYAAFPASRFASCHWIRDVVKSLPVLTSSAQRNGLSIRWLDILTRFFAPQIDFAAGGIEVETHSESPAGAGISGSSALMIATTAAFARFTGQKIELEQIRVIAQNVEAQLIQRAHRLPGLLSRALWRRQRHPS